jgi:hypothetical protein
VRLSYRNGSLTKQDGAHRVTLDAGSPAWMGSSIDLYPTPEILRRVCSTIRFPMSRAAVPLALQISRPIIRSG